MTAEPVGFPDAEAMLVSALSPALGVPVTTAVPNPRPGTFVRVTRVGGDRRDLVTDRPLLVLECWAADSVAAYTLAAQARAELNTWPGTQRAGVWVYRCDEAGGPQSIPDPDTGHPRYQFTVQLHLRGAPL